MNNLALSRSFNQTLWYDVWIVICCNPYFSLDEVSSESHKLSCDLKSKETKVKDLEERLVVLH